MSTSACWMGSVHCASWTVAGVVWTCVSRWASPSHTSQRRGPYTRSTRNRPVCGGSARQDRRAIRGCQPRAAIPGRASPVRSPCRARPWTAERRAAAQSAAATADAASPPASAGAAPERLQVPLRRRARQSHPRPPVARRPRARPRPVANACPQSVCHSARTREVGRSRAASRARSWPGRSGSRAVFPRGVRGG